MSAILNGTTSYFHLGSSPVGVTPTYPVLEWAWIKPANTTHAGNLVTVNDGAAVGAYDCLSIAARGDLTNDPIRADAFASGGSTSVDHVGFVAGVWQFVWVCFESTSTRRIGVGTGSTAATGTTRNATGLANVQIGAQTLNSVTSGYYNGRIAEVGIADGFTLANLAEIVAMLASGFRAADIPQLATSIKLYQAFVADVNEEAWTIGANLTANDVTYDSDDHPEVISPTTLGLTTSQITANRLDIYA